MYKTRKKKSIGSRIGSAIIISTKSTKLLKALKIIKVAKVLKPMVTIVTMLLSLMVYGWAFGWLFGIGLIAMLFIHEMGHVFAMKMRGYPVKAPVFIPMLGAFIFAPKKMSRKTEAFIGIGGPVLGSIGAIIAWLIYLIDPGHSMLWLIMSYIGISINLFNMIPIRPMDGGRITQAVGGWFGWVGAIILLGFTLMLRDPGLLLIWIIVIYDMQKIGLKKRFIIASAVYIIMFLAIIFNIGAGKDWIHWLDLGLATVYMFLFIGIFKFSDKEELARIEKEMADDNGINRPKLGMKQRALWFVKFFGIVVILVGALLLQASSIAPWLHEQKQKGKPELEIKK